MARRILASLAGLLPVALGLVLFAGVADCAELKVISAGAVRSVIGAIIDDYERETGHTFKFTIGSTGRLREVIASGEAADLIIASAPLMGEIEQTGKIAPGSRTDLGRVGMGVVIRDGAAAPDVSTPEALRQALIAAKSIAYTDPKLGGTSYLHLMKIADAFGIAELVTARACMRPAATMRSRRSRPDEAELAVVLVSEIHAKGAKLVGLLPAALQLWTVYSAAVPTSSTEPAHARAFVAALVSPAMRERWTAAGWEPAK